MGAVFNFDRGGSTSTFSGNKCPATSALLWQITGVVVDREVAIDSARNHFIADSAVCVFIKVDVSGPITAVAGLKQNHDTLHVSQLKFRTRRV